jgi:hypothetical protein
MLWDFSGTTTNPVVINSNSNVNTFLQVNNSGTGTASASGIQMVENAGNAFIKMCGTGFGNVGVGAYGPSFLVMNNYYGNVVISARQADVYIASHSRDMGNDGIQRGFVGGGGQPFRNIFLGTAHNAIPLPDDNNLMQVNGGSQSITQGSLYVNLNLGVTTEGARVDFNGMQIIDATKARKLTKNNFQVNAPLASLNTFFATMDVYGSISTNDPDTGLNDAAWELGNVVAGAVVLDNANYVSVKINGIAVKLLKAV